VRKVASLSQAYNTRPHREPVQKVIANVRRAVSKTCVGETPTKAPGTRIAIPTGSVATARKKPQQAPRNVTITTPARSNGLKDSVRGPVVMFVIHDERIA
jgi:hypothetical protein